MCCGRVRHDVLTFGPGFICQQRLRDGGNWRPLGETQKSEDAAKKILKDHTAKAGALAVVYEYKIVQEASEETQREEDATCSNERQVGEKEVTKHKTPRTCCQTLSLWVLPNILIAPSFATGLSVSPHHGNVRLFTRLCDYAI